MALRFAFLSFLLVAHSALANIQKTIFKGPKTVNIPSQHPTLEDLHIDVLNPQDWLLRTHLEAEWPKMIPATGKPSWFLLDNLIEGQRYEVRICWSAAVGVLTTTTLGNRAKADRDKQPSAFRLKVHKLSEVWETPDLISNLAEYSTARLRQASVNPIKPIHRNATTGEREASVLFLQIFSAADYFSLNETLMENIPLVYVDIILDPYLWNLIPHTLLPVIGYIAVIVVPSFALGRRLLAWLHTIAGSNLLGRAKSE